MQRVFSKYFNAITRMRRPRSGMAGVKSVGPFEACLKDQGMSQKTVDKVFQAFEDFHLPVPQSRDEFFAGFEGAILFLPPYGLVMRVEPATAREGDRIDDNPFVLQPIGAVDCGGAKMEFCPIIGLNHETRTMAELDTILEKQGVVFWDKAERNVGLLPHKTVRFPEGMPVVIDRLAVKRLSLTCRVIDGLFALMDGKRTLGVQDNSYYEQFKDVQKDLFGDLQQAFDLCRSDDHGFDKQKTQQFLDACKKAVHDGRLAKDWEDIASFVDTAKGDGIPGSVFCAMTAYKKGKYYTNRLQQQNIKVTPPVMKT